MGLVVAGHRILFLVAVSTSIHLLLDAMTALRPCSVITYRPTESLRFFLWDPLALDLLGCSRWENTG